MNRARNAANYRESIKKRGDTVNRMCDIINRILVISRMDNKTIQFKPVKTDLMDLMKDVKKLIEPSAAGKGIALNLEGKGVVVKGDREGLTEVFTNIVENALDATFDRGDIEVTGRRTNHSVMLTVSDGGCGMAPATIAQVFTPFFTTKTRGTGLGLAIVERLVKALGGTIGLESEPAKGTRCTVTLPLRV